METAERFGSLMKAGRYEEAGELLTDDFIWTGANRRLNKGDWLSEAHNYSKYAPDFDNFEPGDHNLQVTRRGKKRLGFFTIHMIQTIELTPEGKIKSTLAIGGSPGARPSMHLPSMEHSLSNKL